MVCKKSFGLGWFEGGAQEISNVVRLVIRISQQSAEVIFSIFLFS